MASLRTYLQRFDHPVPAAVFSLGLALWALATLVSIVGGILSYVGTISFQLVALLAALLGALGTGLIVIGSLWYGVLLAHDLYTISRS